MKNTPLLQHLCENITSLEERNAKLQQKILQFDKQKNIVCQIFSCKNWDYFMQSILNEKHKKTQIFQNSSLSQSSFKENDYNQMLSFSQNNSSFESSILSQSRVLNRSIRGDTDRCAQYSEIQQFNFQRSNRDTEREDQATLLSIQNTKLRQKIAYLQKALENQCLY